MNRNRLSYRACTLVTACLFLVGSWEAAAGCWIYAKAELAQVLLRQAWSRSLAGEIAPKPWPWADTWPVAKLVVPSRGIDLIVLNGAYGRTLAFGPGFVESSAVPGSIGTTILIGHRDTHFAFLRTLRPGDRVLLHSAAGTIRAYRMRDHLIVDSRTARIRLDRERDELVLMTCYPFDRPTSSGPLRYVVTLDGEHTSG